MRILDRSFRYTPSVGTDIRKTFRRARREMERAAQENDDVVLALQAAGLDHDAAVFAATQQQSSGLNPLCARGAESAAFSHPRRRPS